MEQIRKIIREMVEQSINFSDSSIYNEEYDEIQIDDDGFQKLFNFLSGYKISVEVKKKKVNSKLTFRDKEPRMNPDEYYYSCEDQVVYINFEKTSEDVADITDQEWEEMKDAIQTKDDNDLIGDSIEINKALNRIELSFPDGKCVVKY